LTDSVQGWTYAILSYWVVVFLVLFLMSFSGLLTGTGITYQQSTALTKAATNGSYSATVPVVTPWNLGDYLGTLASFFLFSLDLGLGQPWGILISVIFAWLPVTMTFFAFFFALRSGSS
jgi:hypothetical protein